MKTETLEEVRKNTMKVLGTKNPEDVSYITQDLLDMDYEDEVFSSEDNSNNLALSEIYGHDMAYRLINGEQYYTYKRGGDKNNAGKTVACGEDPKRILWSDWDHFSLTEDCGHGGTLHGLKVRFVRR